MGLKRSVQVSSVDYSAIDTGDILDISRYLMKKTWCKIIFGLTKKLYRIIKRLHNKKFWWTISF